MGKKKVNGLIKKIFSENKEILKKHMKEENVTLKTVNNEIKYILCLLKNDRIHLENENERVFQIKDIFEYLPVKLGYFKIENIPGEVEDPERRVEQCPIISTDKGKAIYSEYERLRSK